MRTKAAVTLFLLNSKSFVRSTRVISVISMKIYTQKITSRVTYKTLLDPLCYWIEQNNAVF